MESIGNINVQTYINDVLVVLFIHFHCPKDNARPHSAAITRQYLATNNVNVLNWPAKSPYLNPIEEVWDELGCRVRRNHVIHAVKDLVAALQPELANLPAPFIQRYFNSMCHIYHSVHCTEWWTYEILTHFIESSAYLISLVFFFSERIIATTLNFQGMSANYDSLRESY